jgi:hypothetical protein
MYGDVQVLRETWKARATRCEWRLKKTNRACNACLRGGGKCSCDLHYEQDDALPAPRGRILLL